jgi:hypothetical protein
MCRLFTHKGQEHSIRRERLHGALNELVFERTLHCCFIVKKQRRKYGRSKKEKKVMEEESCNN